MMAIISNYLRRINMKHKTRGKIGLISFIIIVLINIFAVPSVYAKAVNSDSVSIITGWHYKIGVSPFDNNSLPTWSKESAPDFDWNFSNEPPLVSNSRGSDLWIKFNIKDKNTENFALYFEKIIGDSFEVYLNNKSIYHSNMSSSSKKDNILSNIIIPVREEHYNKVVTIRISSSGNGLIGIDGKVYTGEYKVITKEILGKNIYGVVTGAFFIILSLILLIVTMYFEGAAKKAIISFGLAVLSTGIWNLIGLNNTNILLPDEPVMLFYLYNAASMVTPVAFAYFFEHTFGSGYKSVIRRVWQTLAVYGGAFVLLLAFNLKSGGKLFSFIMSPFMDYLYFILIIAEVLIVFTSAVKASIKGNTDAKIFTFGASILSISVIIYSLNFLINDKFYSK
jgi:hypothetical protein